MFVFLCAVYAASVLRAYSINK